MPYQPMALDFLDDKNFLELRLKPLLKYHAKEFKDFDVNYHLFPVPGGEVVSPEYLVRYKGKVTGFHCGNVRKGDDDDAVRILRFLKTCVSGVVPGAMWMYLRSFGELVRIESGLKPKVKPLKIPTMEAETLYGKPSGVLKRTFDENLRFKEDVLKTAKRHDELFKDKIMAEAPRLEMLGADGGKWITDLAAKNERERRGQA